MLPDGGNQDATKEWTYQEKMHRVEKLGQLMEVENNKRKKPK